MSVADDRITGANDELTDRPPPVRASGLEQGFAGDPEGIITLLYKRVALTILCFCVVAVTSVYNLTLLFLSWGLIDSYFGDEAANTNPSLLLLLAASMQAGLFAVLWFPVAMLTSRKSTAVKYTSLIVLTAVYLGLWAAWTIWLVVEMTRTGSWP